jgi:hypothetical protein
MTTQCQASTPPGGQLSENASIGDVKRFLCRLIRRVDQGRVPVQKANCMGQLANTLINAIHSHEVEERLSQLEADREAGRLNVSGAITIRAGGAHETETADEA